MERTNAEGVDYPHESSIDTAYRVENNAPNVDSGVPICDNGTSARVCSLFHRSTVERGPKVERIEHAGYLRRGRTQGAWVSKTRTRDYAYVRLRSLCPVQSFTFPSLTLMGSLYGGRNWLVLARTTCADMCE